MEAYLKYEFTIEPKTPGTDIIIADLGDLGFESFEETENGCNAYIPETGNIDEEINQLNYPDINFHYTKTRIEQQNWNAVWESQYEPILVDDLLSIRASFHLSNTSVKEEIIINPKMSFGTGHHDTTYLMCKAMFSIDFKNKIVLDMGCGTGILAILASKLGAPNSIGIDNDNWCIENSLENAELNSVKNVQFEFGDSLNKFSKNQFDIILANINKNCHKAFISDYSRVLKPNGILLLSGFFTTDEVELSELASQFGLTTKEKYSKNNWCVLELVKTNS